jgi:hypothetical protein
MTKVVHLFKSYLPIFLFELFQLWNLAFGPNQNRIRFFKYTVPTCLLSPALLPLLTGEAHSQAGPPVGLPISLLSSLYLTSTSRVTCERHAAQPNHQGHSAELLADLPPHEEASAPPCSMPPGVAPPAHHTAAAGAWAPPLLRSCELHGLHRGRATAGNPCLHPLVEDPACSLEYTGTVVVASTSFCRPDCHRWSRHGSCPRRGDHPVATCVPHRRHWLAKANLAIGPSQQAKALGRKQPRRCSKVSPFSDFLFPIEILGIC